MLKKILIPLVSILLFNCSPEPSPTMYTLSVTSNPTDGGTINPTSGEYEDGTALTIRFSPNTNYEFDRWSGDVSGKETSLSITMDSNKSIVGNFVLSDTDEDGVTDDIDQCPDTPNGESVNSTGCSSSQTDTDGDGVNDDVDTCSETPSGQSVDENGCSDSQKDTDEDGVTDDIDQDNNTRSGVPVDENGVMLNPVYLDENGVTIKSQDWGIIGDVGMIDGIEFTIVGLERLKEMISDRVDYSKVVTSKITRMEYLFSNKSPLHSITHWDVSNVTDMTGMLEYTVFNQDIIKWDVSNVRFMTVMFRRSSFNQDISSWETSNLTDISSMFFQNESFNQPIGNWDVSNVTNMYGLFYESPFNQDLSQWNVDQVTNMGFMFYRTPFNYPINNWEVSSLTSTEKMFMYNSEFNQPLDSWNVENITNMWGMFFSSGSMNQDLSNWNVNLVVNCKVFSLVTPNWTLPKPNFTNCDPN